MRLSFITDEVTQDIHRAIVIAKNFDIQGLELRSVDDRQIDQVPMTTIKDWSILLKKEGLAVSDIASSFNKCELNDYNIKSELVRLEALCIIADTFNCQNIRGFSFFMASNGRSNDLEKIASCLILAEPILIKYGKKLLLEADPSVNTTNHHSLSLLLDKLKSNSFGAIYDPGNDLFDPNKEIPYPDGYEAIKSHIAHIHVKDAVYDADGNPLCVAPGSGLVGYGGLIKQLKRDSYDGWLSLEPHYRKDILLTDAQMKLPGGRDFSAGGESAMIESIESLKKLLLCL